MGSSYNSTFTSLGTGLQGGGGGVSQQQQQQLLPQSIRSAFIVSSNLIPSSVLKECHRDDCR
ncbi:hypothetical protein EON65_35405 [archaeon]|nr:MAG: hypothetical protein EON65_35405 [archaeon]